VGIAGNEGADYLAGLGALMPTTPERDWTLPPKEDVRDLGKNANLKFEV
jgi:hypothetical protein